MKRVRACAIVVDGGRVLLLWRKINGNAYYVFPGGGKEEGETIEQAVAREALEETSIVVNVEKFLYKLENETIVNYFYLCSYVSGEPKLGEGNEVGEITESNQYEPMWKEISQFADLEFLPVEVKGWFLDSYNNKQF